MFQLLATGEQVFTYGIYFGRKRHVTQPGFGEGIGAYVSNRIGQFNGFQRGAVVESIALNGANFPLKNHTGESGTISEGALSDILYFLRESSG